MQRMDMEQKAAQCASTAPMRTLNLGKRSGVAICQGRKTAIIVPGTDRRWLPKVKAGSKLRLNFNGRDKGWAITTVTDCCYHEHIATIPRCERRHDPNAIDTEDTWDQILNKALCGGREPVSAEVMERRAAKGWYVVDFAVQWRHPQWCAAMGIAVGGSE